MLFTEHAVQSQVNCCLFIYVNKLPSFPSGKEGLMKYMNKHLKWPQVDGDVQGTVLLSFVVTTGGNIEYFKCRKIFSKGI